MIFYPHQERGEMEKMYGLLMFERLVPPMFSTTQPQMQHRMLNTVLVLQRQALF